MVLSIPHLKKRRSCSLINFEKKKEEKLVCNLSLNSSNKLRNINFWSILFQFGFSLQSSIISTNELLDFNLITLKIALYLLIIYCSCNWRNEYQFLSKLFRSPSVSKSQIFKNQALVFLLNHGKYKKTYYLMTKPKNNLRNKYEFMEGYYFDLVLAIRDQTSL